MRDFEAVCAYFHYGIFVGGHLLKRSVLLTWCTVLVLAFCSGCNASPADTAGKPVQTHKTETDKTETDKAHKAQGTEGATADKQRTTERQPEKRGSQATHDTQTRPSSIPKEGDFIAAPVTRVVDGDTIKVDLDGRVETVRFVLIDTPETVHPSKPVEPFGPEASDFTKKMLEGQTVELELDAQERDRYGRLLAYIWLGDQLFNETLLEKGLARVAVFPPNVKYVDEFRAVQKKAQREGVGIWSLEHYAAEESNPSGGTTGAPQSKHSKHSTHAHAKQDQSHRQTGERTEHHHSHSQRQQAASKDSTGCADPQVKGNINSRGEKIYHVPGGAYYDRTIPEDWFCTEADAEAAGFRPSMR